MSQLILASQKEIEFNKKFTTQLMLNSLLIASNFFIWIAAIFVLCRCEGPTSHVSAPYHVTIHSTSQLSNNK